MMHDRKPKLTRDLRRRRPVAWSAVYDAHASEVFGFVYHLMGGDRLAAEEICQETWLAGIDRIEQFDEQRGNLRTWLFAIARQRVALHFRRLSAKDTRFEVRDVGLDAYDDSLLPDEVLERIERVDAVRAAMVVLPEDRRIALTAKYVDGLTVEQVAAHAGKTKKATESLLSRARAQMRSLLAWYFDSPDESNQKEASDGRSTVS